MNGRVPGRLALSLGLALAAALSLAPAANALDDVSGMRRRMVEEQIRQRGVTDARVLESMERVPRHLFVPGAEPQAAYADRPLPFGPKGKWGTIYQPYVVALMTSLLELTPNDKVLEIGTGSGYHAAVLSHIARAVYSIEISPAVAGQAERRLALLGFGNVIVRVGDGYQGWPDEAPFDAILLSAAPPEIPKPLLDQLKKGGRMVAPVGDFFQDLQVITKRADGSIEKRIVSPVRLSPMTGKVRNGQRRR
ncbi:MAG TPA: protein-L-isoaspartate(D-aspartate) O-methyltransferase [Thermoanaerobaculia bacterium]|nr:protein-L-isoaspartate(D-aspartate) O-methyltransferase [Thermoanaerobaculia bacterium]